MTGDTRAMWRLADPPNECQHCGEGPCVVNLTTYPDGRPPLMDAECRRCGGANDWLIPDEPGEHWHVYDPSGDDPRSACHSPDADTCRRLTRDHDDLEDAWGAILGGY